MKPRFSINQRLAACLTVGVVLLGLAAPGYAQASHQSTASTDPVDWVLLSEQLTTSLDSPIAQIRQESLQLINFFATNHGAEIDLDDAIPKLVSMYESDAQESIRILALAGLHAIGNAHTMAYLKDHVGEQRSRRVRQLTLAAVADFESRTRKTL